jgi:zinc D-Ala-D-Ala carboxypeptidase
MNYFSDDELSCKCCNENRFNANTLNKLNELRKACGFALKVNSGYRCKAYNTLKGYTQTHATGQAVDISLTHEQAYIALKYAVILGFTGIGVKQKGNGRFIHLDDLLKNLDERRPRPHVWSY